MDIREAIDGWLAQMTRQDAEKQAQVAVRDDDPPMPAGARLLIDGKATRKSILDTVRNSVIKRFPIEDDKYRLELLDVDYDGPTHYTLAQQKQAILHNRKLGCSLKGTWRLTDKETGKVLEEKRDAVMRVPYYTNRGTIINNGSEYTVISQARLSPGVYTRRKQNGDLESQFNVANGKGFRLTLDKSTGRMTFRMGQANLPLYPVLKAMGISDEQLAKSWGHDVALANAEKNDPKTIQRLYEKIAGYKMDPLMTPQNQTKFIKDELSKFGLDPHTVVRTLGIENVKGVTPEVLLRASQKLLNVNRGIEEPDNRDNPRFSKFYGVEHMLGERIDKDAAKLLKPMLFRIRRDKNLSRVGRNALGPYIDDFLSTSGLAQPGEEANPMSILIQQSRITRTGEGGISSPDLITPEARGVQGDYLGFVDFIATPESSSAGVDVRAAYGTVLGKDNKLYNVFRNMQTGKKEYLSLDAAADKVIAFPDQDPKAPYMYVMKNGVPGRVKTSEVDYMVPSFSRTLGAGINMNPMPTAVFGQRSFYSSKFWEQYLPQKEGEVPMVDSLMPDGKMTFNEYYGRRSGCVTAPFSGTVTKVTKDEITITGKNGKTETFDLVTNLPYNRMSVTGDTEVLIRRGGIVTKLKIEDYAQSAEDEILSYDPDTMKSGWSKISGFTRHANIKQLYRVTYKSGRHVDVTEDHSLITLSDTFSFIPIYPKDCHIGKTRSPIVHGDPGLSSGWSYDQGVVDGLYLSEGSLRGLDSGGVYHACSIACLPKERRTYLASVLRSLGFRPQPASIVRTRARTSLISGRHVSGSGGEVVWTSKELATRWEEDFGVHSYGKRIGGHVFGRGREYLHGLLAGYMAGDGCLHQDTYGSVQIEASTVSRQLRNDLVAVCTMLGLMVTLRGPRRNGDGCRPLYTFRISTGSASSLSPLFAYPDRQRKLELLLSHTFNSTVGGHKAMWYEHVPVLTARARRFLYSCISGKVSDYIYKSTSLGAVSKRRIAACAGKPGMLGRSDILWDVVSDIQPIAHQDYVYDFSVDGSEAFALANGLLVHNTQLSLTPLVKKGMEIKEGDILAHSNFTDAKTGAFNMGRNLKVAILPGPRGANSVTGDTFVFWRKPDGAYTFTPISEAIPWGGMKSIAMDQKTLDHGVADCMSWMIHRPDSPLYEVTLQDGFKVVVTGSHGLMRYDGRSGIESCRADQVLSGDLMPFVKARIPYGTGDSVVRCTGLQHSSGTYELTVPLDREFGWFIGIYLAEGCVAYKKSDDKDQPRWINIACTEQEMIDHIAAACKRMGASYKYVAPGVSKTGVKYGGVMRIHHAALCHFLADNTGRYAWGKRIPDCLWTAPREFAEGLIDGYFCGDGTVGDRQATITTASRALAEALCLVFSSFGIRANCRQYKFSTPMQKHPVWMVTILGEHLSLMPFISLSRKRMLLEKLASVRSSGKFSRDRVPVPKAMRGRYIMTASGTKRQVPYLSYIGRNKYRLRIPEGISRDADNLFARTDIWWDVVKSVRRLSASERNDSIVYDLDMSPYGTFMVGYGLIVHNSFEDACIISEDAAKKLATSRMYNFDQDTKNGVSVGKNKFLAAFPDAFTKEQAETLDDSGVVKVGTELHRGDPIIAAIGPKLLSAEDAQLGKLSSVLKKAVTNKAQTWNHDWPGVVTDVVAGPSGAKVLIKSEPPVKVGDKLCYDEDTEVLTAHGWKFFRDVTLDDNVATLNPETFEFDYLQPEMIRRYEHEGRMYRMSNSCLDLMVTDNHRMFVQRRGHNEFEFLEAKDILGKRVSYKKDGVWNGIEIKTFTFPAYTVGHRWGLLTKPETVVDMDTFLMLLGMYLSEGNIKANAAHRVFGIDITQVKAAPLDEARKALDEAGIAYSYNRSGHKIFISGRQYADYFSQFGKAWEKYIPEFVFGLSPRQQKILFKWLMWGDGHCVNGVPKVYTTTSRRLADDVQRLCLHIGIAGRVVLHDEAGSCHGEIDGRRIIAKHDCYSVQIINSKLTPTVNHGHIRSQHAQKEGYVDYSGYVYCCTMPKWHAIYVRRNGHACWCGNSPRFALKGVTGTILPMDKMPRDAVTNEPYDMIVNPMGFLSRVAPGQLMEIALGKVAKKTGQQIRIPQVPPPEGWLNWTKKQLADAGVSDTADVFDPQTGRTIKGVGDGYMYVQAMHHLAEKKYSARGIEGGYTQDQQPAKGGETGAKKISGFDVNALLSHGATEVLRDAITTRGQKNEEYWRKLRLGLPIPEPDVPFIYQKFLNNLRAGGINVVEKGDITTLMPQTDAAIDKLTEGRIIDSAQMVDANMNPVKGGLFDLGKTGGAGGMRWSMIELPEPVPNPVMEEPVRRVLGLTSKKMSDILSGREQLNGKTGGAAIKEALASVDVGRLIEQSRNDIKTKRGSARDNAIKVLGYLTAAQEMKMSPKDWMISKVPVIPPAFRPISKVGDVALVPDTNELYKELLENKHNYELLKKDLPDSALTEERLNLYKSVKAAFGLGNSITTEGQAKNLKGPIRQIIGTVPKWGQFQSKVVAKNQDLVGRSVTVPDKNLSMDQVGIPEDMAWTMYKPFVTRKLVQRGYSPVDVAKMIEDRTPTARHILDDVMEEKPVLMDRAPTWHKFNIMAFKPFITDGKEIRVCPMIDSGYNMDHDGDECRSPYITTLIDDNFFNTLAIDNDTDECYNPCITKQVIKDRAMRKDSVVVNGKVVKGTVVSLRWDEFPHYDNPTLNNHPNANFYLVPEGIFVRAYDEITGNTIWAPVKYWSHHGVNQKLEIITVNLSSGRQILTDDDPRGVYGIDPETMKFGRWRPSESIGKFVPRCIKDDSVTNVVEKVSRSEYSCGRLAGDMSVDRESGWFLGAMIGDGWNTIDKGKSVNVCFCYDKNYNDIGDRFKKTLCHAIYDGKDATFGIVSHEASKEPNRYGDCITIRHASCAAGEFIDKVIGHGAENKHLPPFWQNTSKEFRLGLFEGLMDTDGTVSLTKAKVKKNRQLVCNYTSVSMTLATEVQYLCRTLGIDSKLTTQKTPAGGKCWQVSISTKNLKSLGLKLYSPKKAENLANADIRGDSSAGGRKYMIPVPVKDIKKVSGIILAFDKAAYVTLNRTVKKGYVPTTIADKIAKVLKSAPDLQTDSWKRWLELYENIENVVWERVESFTNTGMFEDGFDLTVPGYDTFMNSDGVILSNTVNIHVPASDKASREALEKMLPSKNLLSLTDMTSVRYKPEKEQVSGLWALTAGVSNKKPRVFNSKAEAIRAYRDGEIGPTDPVVIM